MWCVSSHSYNANVKENKINNVKSCYITTYESNAIKIVHRWSIRPARWILNNFFRNQQQPVCNFQNISKSLAPLVLCFVPEREIATFGYKDPLIFVLWTQSIFEDRILVPFYMVITAKRVVWLGKCTLSEPVIRVIPRDYVYRFKGLRINMPCICGRIYRPGIITFCFKQFQPVRR